MKTYIASPFFNKEQLDFVKRIEETFDSVGLDFFSPRSEGILINMSQEEKEERMVDIFNSNINHIKECNFMLAVIDGFDTGTMIEVGSFFTLEKPVFTITNNDFGLNIMLRQMSHAHNKNPENAIINIIEYIDNKPLTIFEELTKDVT